MKIYVASSWRNTTHPEVVDALRAEGHEVYDFRNPRPGNNGFAWERIDPNWLCWTPDDFCRHLYAEHPEIERGYGFDKEALDWCEACVCVLPCGRSAHLEAGYCAGQGKLTLFLLSPDRFEPELMYLLGGGCATTIRELIGMLDTLTDVALARVSFKSWEVQK